MAKRAKYTLWAVIALSFMLGLVPVERTNPPVTGDVAAPLDVGAVLRRSCYDCHSNETRWPLYAYLAPVSWLVAHDVNEGREALNFSEWQSLSSAARTHAREETWEEVEEGDMPLGIYLLLHPSARVKDSEKERLRAWSESPDNPAGPGTPEKRAPGGAS